MKLLLILSLLWLSISCGSAPESKFNVSSTNLSDNNDIVVGNSEDSTVENEDLTENTNDPEEENESSDDLINQDTDNKNNPDDSINQDTNNKDNPENPLLASSVYDSQGDLHLVDNLFENAEYAVLALFDQNCALCESMALTLERNQRTQKLVSSDRCEISLIFDDFGNENNVLDSISKNLPNFVAGRSFVRSNSFIDIEHFGPLYLAINKQGEIVKQMRLLSVVENFCRQ